MCKISPAIGKSSNQKLLTQLENACGGVSVRGELSSDVFDGFWGLSGRGVRKWVGKKLRKKRCGRREWSMMVQSPLLEIQHFSHPAAIRLNLDQGENMGSYFTRRQYKQVVTPNSYLGKIGIYAAWGK